MEEKSMMLMIFMLFGIAVLLVVVGLLVYTGYIRFPSLDFWGVLGSMFEFFETKLPAI